MNLSIFLLLSVLKCFINNNNWHNLKLEVEDSSFILGAKNNNLKPEIINLMTKNIFIILKEYLFISFYVKEKQEVNLKDYKFENKYPLKKIFKNKLIGKDLILKISYFNEQNSTLAKAKPIGFNYLTKRPNIGIILLNINFLKKIKYNEKIFKENLLILLHETFHILGFNQNGINKIDNKIKKNKEEKNIKIKSYNVWKIARKHFNCNTLKYLLFENNLTSHWEDIQLGSEIQLAQNKRNLKISDITFGFFEDLGWYKVNYNMSQKLSFGLNKGCDFINNPSIKFEEFSNKYELRCSNDYNSISRFIKTPFSNEFFIKTNNTKCVFRNYKKSSCVEFIKTNISPKCIEAKCLKIDKNIFVEYKYYDIKLICKKDEEIINKYGIKLKCPKIKKFCEYKYECKNNCNGKGICLNGECICNKNYKGFACEFKNEKKIKSYDMNKKCNFNGYYKNNKCICYENYNGERCQNIIIDLGSFSSNCKNSIYIKCYKGDYYNYFIKNKNHLFQKIYKNIMRLFIILLILILI